MLLDWGQCHRLLDAMQLATSEKDLAPRVRLLLKQLVRQVGWPSKEAPPEWWAPIESTPEHEKRNRRKKRK